MSEGAARPPGWPAGRTPPRGRAPTCSFPGGGFRGRSGRGSGPGLEEQAHAGFLGRAVGLAAVAGAARGDRVQPGRRAASRDRQQMVEGVAGTAAVGAPEPVATQHRGPSVDRRPVHPGRDDVTHEPHHLRPRVRSDHPVVERLLDHGDLTEEHAYGVLERHLVQRLVRRVEHHDAVHVRRHLLMSGTSMLRERDVGLAKLRVSSPFSTASAAGTLLRVPVTEPRPRCGDA